ncbi:hypothetical protein, partial [Epilithonimonas tenax]|uniref:hypothetical protein n=1 Tax=Epilithonimonas tenax TaxID=191577 RepID=UPI000555B0E4
MQNSTVVFQLNITNNIGFCASISRPNAKPQNVSGQATSERENKRKLQLKMSKFTWEIIQN